jgi:hypothetical protein
LNRSYPDTQSLAPITETRMTTDSIEEREARRAHMRKSGIGTARKRRRPANGSRY